MKAPGVRAVIIPHLFGLPLDLAPVVELAARRGIAIIEDCAHCLGGKVSDRMAGTMGDFAVFSFSYDKPISLGGGGMLVCNQEQLPREFAEFRMRRRSGPGAWDEEIGNLREFRAWLARKRSALALSSVSTRARFVGRVRGSIEDCVRIRWMLKRFITPRGMFRLPPTVGSVRAELGRGLLSTYDCIRTHRIRNHESLARELESTGCVEMMSAPHDVAPAWLKAKLRLAPSVEDRVAPVCERLRSAGFAAGRLNWPRTLDREASTAFSARSIGSLDNAHRMAASAIDLPIHQRMGDRQLREMALQIRECAEPRNRR
jgi:dTDP-4-amino-4,6-dideoxygalactose transaminase